MATYGDDLGRQPGAAAEADSRHGSRRGVAGETPTGLPAPVLPPPTLPPPKPAPASFPGPAPRRADAATSSAVPPFVAARTSGPGSARRSELDPNSYSEIRAVHEATTRQLRERRSSGNGRAAAIACAVVVGGGIAFVLASLLV